MKKALIVLLVIVIAAGVLYIVLWISNSEVGSFQLEDYEEHVAFYEKVPDENVPEFVGPVLSAKDARVAAETIFMEVFGASISRRKPYKVFFDEKNQVWYIYGTVFFYETGPCALIRKNDGKVLAIWGYKF